MNNNCFLFAESFCPISDNCHYMTIVALNDEEKSPRWKARNLNPFGIISFIEIIGSEYLKLFVANCKNVYKLSCRRSLSVTEVFGNVFKLIFSFLFSFVIKQCLHCFIC